MSTAWVCVCVSISVCFIYTLDSVGIQRKVRVSLQVDYS